LGDAQKPKVDRLTLTLLAIPLFWWAFFAGLGAPLIYGFYIDLTLLGVGIYGLIALLRNWKAIV